MKSTNWHMRQANAPISLYIRCYPTSMPTRRTLIRLDGCPGWSDPEVIKLFSCSTQFSTKFFLLINVKMPTIVGILTFRSRKNSILSLSESEKSWISWYFYTYEHLKFHAHLSWAWKKFYNLGPWSFAWRTCHFVDFVAFRFIYRRTPMPRTP